MSLSDVDRLLLDRCLQSAPRAWEDFVDRFLGLVVHVARHTAAARSLPLDSATLDDLVADVFLKLVENDFAILRRFRRQCSLATYLAVVSRRVIVRRLLSNAPRHSSGGDRSGGAASPGGAATAESASQGGMGESRFATNGEATRISSVDEHEARIDDRDHVEQLLNRLDPQEAHIVRMYHLEGKSYREISQATGLSENTIGPTLSRAREQLRRPS
ncbi:sigma-70 family RNA polymerase sigma factor [Candidatus Laterigemmans baculatus]|uniref:sigma-70 family RNA polymerase sigma factor n=1 Tax=Candidatus Laterigemmans baculatus TaxID=2770505 RepID=UPI0013DBF94E|nr:sigma-70 family RNA polymerase sigma factor [Candidatus Laterigemmans baculatus]